MATSVAMAGTNRCRQSFVKVVDCKISQSSIEKAYTDHDQLNRSARVRGDHVLPIRHIISNLASSERRRAREGLAFFVAFGLTIPIANWMIGHVGTVCVVAGPCLIPVGLGLLAPSGVLIIGIAFVLRDLVQRRLGIAWTLAAIAGGTILSAALAPPQLVVASGLAFFVSELADFAVYTPLARRRFVLAVALSSGAGLAIDSALFLILAFGSLNYLNGQVVGKALAVCAALPIIAWLRIRDARLRLMPA